MYSNLFLDQPELVDEFIKLRLPELRDTEALYKMLIDSEVQKYYLRPGHYYSNTGLSHKTRLSLKKSSKSCTLSAKS